MRWRAAALTLLASLFAPGALARAPADPVLRWLERGVRVEVKAREERGGRLIADSIEIRDERDDDEELRGNIASVGDRTITLLGFTVRVPEGTPIGREPDRSAGFAELVPGLRVKVDGRRSGEGEFFAEKIKIRARQYRERKLVGPIEQVVALPAGGAELTVVGRRILVAEGTEILGIAPEPVLATRRLGVLDDDDVRFAGGMRLARRVRAGGEVRLRVQRERNFDLVGGTATPLGQELRPEITFVVGALADLGVARFYAELRGEREFFLDGGDPLIVAGPDRRDRGDVRIGEAYVEFGPFGRSRTRLAIGRQKFNEEREWFYNNENLDAVRLLGSIGRVAYELSASSNLFDTELRLRDQQLTNYMAQLRWSPTRDLLLEGYAIRRIENEPPADGVVRTPAGSRLEHYGLRLLGDPGRYVEFWADAAVQRGLRPPRGAAQTLAAEQPIRAHAFDAGLTLRPRWGWDPTLTLAYAAGSGDADPDDGVDRTFRQTGLQRNRWRWNGVVSFRYYGEVVDPELTNLQIVTAGVGIRPTRSISADLVFHGYRQDALSDNLSGSDLEFDPLGLDRDLGREWDLVLGYEPGRRLELRLTAGLFEPGAAFPKEARSAVVIRFQAKFRF